MLNQNEIALLTKGIKLNRKAMQPQPATPVKLMIVTADGRQYDVSGTVTVGADYERLATVEIPLLRTMAALACKAGVVGDAIVNMVTEAIGMALEEGTDAAASLNEMCPRIEAAMANVRERLSEHLPQQQVNGAVTVKAAVKEVQVTR